MILPMDRVCVFLYLSADVPIGAKTALNILSSMNIPSFCTALAQGDIKALKKIKVQTFIRNYSNITLTECGEAPFPNTKKISKL